MSRRNFIVPVEGAQLHGERRDGTGVPLVLVHGFGGSRRDWDPVAAALPQEQSLIAYDQRGFGSSRAERGCTFSHAEDLLALLDALEVERADLCGLSLGGATAIAAALARPERVRAVVLISPMLAGWSWSAEWVEGWKTIGRAARNGDMKRARELWWAHPLFASTRTCRRGEALHRAIAAFSGDQWIQDDQRAELPMVGQLHALANPTLLLTGGLDLPDFRLMAQRIEAAVPDLERFDDPGAGHLLTLEQPEATASAIASFLAAQ